ncbi:MAG TPA: diguanylate cyclase [Pyrinomonadaceae bacterium]|nr:diguanylate cyclase [Pyrinomonadaceae bacterium]
MNDQPPAVILFADDEEVNRTLIKRRLSRAGYEVITATNGAEAVEQAQRRAPDLVVLDLMMPVMDGQQACRLLKADGATKDLPVIILSARDETEVKVKCLTIGANDYVSKPFRVEELIARIEVAIRLKRERDSLRASADEAQARADAAYEKTLLDALTGLLNRHGLQRALARELSGARRYGRALSCLMFDIDHFKKINDTLGHPTGDLAITQFASALQETMRGSDIVCRYGGEEFLALLPETNLTGAATLAEKVRAAVAAGTFGEEGNNFSVTISVGVAELQGEESGNDMIARADTALYRAKQMGRNRVEVAVND